MARAPSTLLARHGRRMARRRAVVIPLFLLLLAVAIIFAMRSGEVMTADATLPGSESEAAGQLIERHFSDGERSVDLQPVFRHPTLTVTDPEYRRAVEGALARAVDLVPGARSVSYFTSASRDLVGQDGRMTYATISLPLPEQEAQELVPELREAIGTPPGFLPTLVGGDVAVWHDTAPVIESDLARAHTIVLPIALLILLLFFGSLVSALVPLLVAGMTIMLALAGTWAVGQTMDIADLVTQVITLVGIAIGIDYSLLLVSRFREEIAAGHDREEAVARTVAGAGRAVLLAGVTVAIGLAVLVALPIPFMRSLGIGGMLVPVAAVFTGLTLLPAVLAALGPRVDSLRVYPRRWRLRSAVLWGPISRVVTGRAAPVVALVGIAALAALASQAGGLSTAQDPLADTARHESVEAGLLVRQELGGAFNPNVYVVDSGRPGGLYRPEVAASLDDLADELRGHRELVSGVTWPQAAGPDDLRRMAGDGLIDATGQVALLRVAPHGDAASPTGRALTPLMERERVDLERLLPEGQVLITGEPAVTAAFGEALYGPFPWLVLAVLAITLLAMMRAFRSWLLPLTAVVMAGLSLLATYGLLYLVFQRGIGADLVGIDGPVRGIAFWVPVMLFAFLFGIAMDYQVFLAERMRELRAAGMPGRIAVREGLGGTGRVVGVAALIMMVAFSGFAVSTDMSMKQFGVGLTAAIAIDALLVRCLIVPAVLAVAGERAWVLPRPLARALRLPSPSVAPARSIDGAS